MDKFDRVIQKDILSYLYEVHPDAPNQQDLEAFATQLGGMRELYSTLIYLHEHGLIVIGFEQYLGGYKEINVHKTNITCKGIDFIRDDGGLGAILNVQTIKFHRDAIVVLEDLIAISNMSDQDKEQAKSTLGELPLEALKTVVQAATTAGLTALMK